MPPCFRLLILAPVLILHALVLSSLKGAVVGETGPGDKGWGNTSMAMVDGRPAIAWVDLRTQSVRYARALDADGRAWGEVKTVDSSPSLEIDVTLRVMNGRPAVCCMDESNVRFIRAGDAAGDTWLPSTPVMFTNGFRFVVMEIISGRAAILTNSGGTIIFMRATDPDATVWTKPAPVAVPDGANSFSLKEIQGLPALAISAFDTQTGGGLWYTRATNVNGTAWTPPKALTEWTEAVSCSLQVVGNLPVAAAFVSRDTTSDLIFVRAADPFGNAWNAQSVLIGGGAIPLRSKGAHLSLAAVNGKPAISFASGTIDSDLLYTQARDSTGAGSEAWEIPGTLDSNDHTGFHPSLLEVNGAPAVAYIDQSTGEIKYLRATVTNGATLWPPELSVRRFGEFIPRGSGAGFGSVTLGATSSLTLTVHNPGLSAAPLHFIDFALVGDNADEFSILTLPPDPLPAGASAELVLASTPATPGAKFATLRITSNASASPVPYDVPLSAECLPDFRVERSGGIAVNDSMLIDFPVTPPDRPATLIFHLKNPGGAPLESLSLTIDGPDSAEFTVVTAPPAVLAPGTTATIAVRHAPLAMGRRMATLHIVNNLANDERNPFDIPLRMIPGAVDESFAPAGDPFLCVALEPDGRILAGGNSIVSAFKPDGSRDTAFFAPVLDGAVTCIAVQRDGSILLGGDFKNPGGLNRPGLARMLPDGTIDAAFDARVDTGVACIGIQSNGKILVGGEFQSRADPTRRNLVRLHPDGTLDTSFFSSFQDRVTSLTALPAERWLVTDLFYNAPYSLQRIGPNGLGEPFAPPQLTENLRALAWRPDGVLLGANLNGGAVRLLPDGTQSPPGGILSEAISYHSFGMQANGVCVAAGGIRVLDDLEPQVRRVMPDGTVDPVFETAAGIAVRSVALQEDGRVILAGDFTQVNGVERTGLARLTSEPAVSALTRGSTSAVRWMRGGTAPEVSDVSFEMNTPGDPSWTLLGFASRIPGGWELTSLNLPSSCQIRARGRAGGSLTQMVASYFTPLESWRLEYFHTLDNSGAADDDADPDCDGLTNFTEYAFSLNPVNRSSNTLPEFKHNGTSFTAAFSAPVGTEDILYRAEWSPSMQPGTWVSVPDTGTAGRHAFHIPAAGEKVFVRYAVTLR